MNLGKSSGSSGNRSVSIGGDATGSSIVSGDRNVVTTNYQRVTLPAAESVDISAELKALRGILEKLDSPDGRKIANALTDAEDELTKPEPDKDEVGKALQRALEYADKAERFADVTEKLVPHLKSVAAWLGQNWYKILGVVALVV